MSKETLIGGVSVKFGRTEAEEQSCIWVNCGQDRALAQKVHNLFDPESRYPYMVCVKFGEEGDFVVWIFPKATTHNAVRVLLAGLDVDYANMCEE